MITKIQHDGRLSSHEKLKTVTDRVALIARPKGLQTPLDSPE